MKNQKSEYPVMVERPLLRCRFRAGYLVRRWAAGGGRRPGRPGCPDTRVAGQRNWVTPGLPPPTNYVHARYRTRVFQSHPYLIGHHGLEICTVLFH